MALEEMGGSGEIKEVLDRVREIMGPKLNEVDRENLNSGEPRWRNKCRWARSVLVNQGK